VKVNTAYVATFQSLLSNRGGTENCRTNDHYGRKTHKVSMVSKVAIGKAGVLLSSWFLLSEKKGGAG